MSKIAISEMFRSIQGEGIYLGEPSLFIRTNFCNLRCSFCDSGYTSLTPEDAPLVDVEDLAERVREYPGPHIVITGGEPTIWKKSLVELSAKLKRMGKRITLETNGTIYLQRLIGNIHLFSVSPKLSSVAPSHERFLSRHQRGVDQAKETINKYIYDIPVGQHVVQIKFVVDSLADIEEIESFLGDIRGLQLFCVHVVLMPQGKTAEEYHQKDSWLVEVCKEKGWRYTPRIHLDIWGPVRGV